MNLDYAEALKRAEQVVANGEVSRDVMARVFKEFSYTNEQKLMSQCLEFLAELGCVGRNANFDRYKSSDIANWISVIKEHFFKEPFKI